MRSFFLFAGLAELSLAVAKRRVWMVALIPSSRTPGPMRRRMSLLIPRKRVPRARVTTRGA